MASGPRRLSFAKLVNALNIDKSRADFVEVHAGNAAALDELFDNLESLKKTSPPDYERLTEAAKSAIESPDQLIDILADEIYGADDPAASGIRNQGTAPEERVERVGAASDAGDQTTLPDPPPPPSDQAAQPKRRGRKKKDETPPPPETVPAAPPADPNSPITVSAGGAGEQYTGMPAAPDFQMDTTPAAMQRIDPYGVGFDRLLAQQYMQQPTQSGMPPASAPLPFATGMADPSAGAFAPPRTDISQLDMSGVFGAPRTDISQLDLMGAPSPAALPAAGRPTPPPDGMGVEAEIDAMNALVAPPAPEAPTFSVNNPPPMPAAMLPGVDVRADSAPAPLSGLLDAGTSPPPAGSLPGVSVRPTNDPADFYNWDMSKAPPPKSPDGAPSNMIGTLLQYVRNNPKKTMLGAAALGGYGYFNRPQPNVNAVSDEQAAETDAALQQALDDLQNIQGPNMPVGIPPRR